MSGSLLGRGRGSRLAMYGGCGVVLIFLVFLYRAATSEMARLRELHVQCAHQQEALAAQLQVIFEYKVRLEKSLAEEKSSNAAVKQELQQRASREKTLRDRDSVEAMQRFNSLQQTYNLLQTAHTDLQEECKKREKQALEDIGTLESTLKELRNRIKQAREDKEKALNHLKNKCLELGSQKGNTDSTVESLKKEVLQLKRDLTEARELLHKSASPSPSVSNPQPLQPVDTQMKSDDPGNIVQPFASLQQQQSTVMTSSMKSIPVVRWKSSTPASNSNLASTAANKVLPLAKPVSKPKLPIGVPPIPIMVDQKREDQEEKQDEEARKKEEPKQNNNLESKEQDIENGNLDPPFPARRVDDQSPDRQANGWINMDPGVQEIGEESNHVRLAGMDVGGERNAEAADEHYENVDYDKEPQQKNSDLQLVESEGEGEDEDDQIDYPHNLKQEKRE